MRYNFYGHEQPKYPLTRYNIVPVYLHIFVPVMSAVLVEYAGGMQQLMDDNPVLVETTTTQVHLASTRYRSSDGGITSGILPRDLHVHRPIQKVPMFAETEVKKLCLYFM